MQITEELVRQITQELLRRLNSGRLTVPEVGDKPLVHIVGGRDHLSTKTLDLLAANFKLHDHLTWDEALPPKAKVLISRLGLQALVQVAEGDQGCTVEGRVLMEAILNGQTVVALEEGLVWRHYVSTAPKPLLALYARHERTLQTYGLKLAKDEDLINLLAGGSSCRLEFKIEKQPMRPEQPDSRICCGGQGRAVITEAALKAACPDSQGPDQNFNLPFGALLTPLARDYAQALKINLIINPAIK